MAYLFLLHVAGALALFLWAIHMVQSGVDRGWRPEITALFRWASGAIRPAALGVMLAAALQSATATAMLATSFSAKGMLTNAAGLAILLGADLGSALVVYFLSLNIQVLAPIFLLVGVALFFKSEARRLRQSGRALAGVGLVFVSLALLGDATAPLRESPLLPGIMAYLGNDPITAMLAGAAIAWLLHSSVAAIVLLVTLTTHGLVPIEAATSLLIGCNIGGALIPIGLTRTAPAAGRRIVVGNLILRSVWAAIALLALVAGARGYIPGSTAAVQLVNLHLIFNAALLLVGLPLRGPVSAVVSRLVRPSTTERTEGDVGLPPTCLDPTAINEPSTALANTTRELVRMAEIVARMLDPIMDIYRTGDAEKIRQAKAMEGAVNRAQSDIKLYLAKVSYTATEQEKHGHDLAAIAVNLEHVGDAITKTLLRLAETRSEQRLSFSPNGWRELSELHQSVVASMRLAQNVLVTRDLTQARQLVHHKSEVRALVDESMRHHMQRLRDGTPSSVATSNIHLETIRALKTINSLLAAIGYGVLANTGDVLDSRLKPAG